MKGNVINLNTLHLNSVRLNGIGKVQSVSLKGGSTEDPVFPPVEPPIEPEPTPTYTLSASVTNGMVSATRNGSAVNLPYTANEGDVIVVEVTPNDGYEFNGWNDGNTDNPRSITMNADVALSAQCVEVVQPPVGNYIQFEDAEVERVLMSKGVSSDGVGITMEDAAKVTKFQNWFRDNKTIETFNELQYFTGVSKLEYRAFLSCTNLREVALPSNSSEVGQAAFQGCTSLRKVIVPQSCKTITKEAFSGCGNLSEINLEHIENFGMDCFSKGGLTTLSVRYLKTWGSYCFNGNKNLANVTIDGTITEITTGSASSGMFSNCSSLASVKIYPTITKVGSSAFLNCVNAEDIDISWEYIENIEKNAFDNCKVENVVIPAIVSIGLYSFARSYAKVVDMGASISSIASYAFYRCYALEKVICRATTPPTLDGTAFKETSSTFIIYVPDASLEAYKTATNWKQYSARIKPLSEYVKE